MANATRIGFVGCGWISMTHLQSLDLVARSKLVDVEVVAAHDADPERLKVVARLRPGIKLYDDATALIRSNAVDAVFICTPTKFHKDYVAKAAIAGKDIFCEKPMATNLKDAEEMLHVVEKACVKAQVGLVMRFDPLLNYSKQLIDENKKRIEPAMNFVLRDDQFFPIRGQYHSTWRKDKDITGGGTLIEHSIHDVDFMRWFFGDIEDVRASVRYFSGREVEDEANLWLKFENGAEGMLSSIWHELGMRGSSRLIEIFYNKALFHLELDGETKSAVPWFYQMGEEAPIKIGYKKANDYIKEKLGIQSKYELGEYTYQDYSFIKSIQSNSRPQPDFAVGVYAHKVVEAAYTSAKQDATIKLNKFRS
ncbi:MAG: Gfo/Idh/MocA family oxidoreductase [Candidatus Atabeyarchaeum deiterrae]